MGSDGGTIGHFNSLQAFMRQVCVDKDYERRALATTRCTRDFSGSDKGPGLVFVVSFSYKWSLLF